MSLSGRDLTSLCFLLHLLPCSSPPACSPGPRRGTSGMMSHTCLAGGCGPAMLTAVGVTLAPLVAPPLTPPCLCLLRPVDVSKWQMMVGVCAAAWEEECQGRSFPAVSFNLLYPHLLKNPTPQRTHTHTLTHPSPPINTYHSL